MRIVNVIDHDLVGQLLNSMDGESTNSAVTTEADKCLTPYGYFPSNQILAAACVEGDDDDHPPVATKCEHLLSVYRWPSDLEQKRARIQKKRVSVGTAPPVGAAACRSAGGAGVAAPTDQGEA